MARGLLPKPHPMLASWILVATKEPLLILNPSPSVGLDEYSHEGSLARKKVYFPSWGHHFWCSAGFIVGAACLVIGVRVNSARKEMSRLKKFSKQTRLWPSLVLVAFVLLASWMGVTGGGYFVTQWTLSALTLATLALVASIIGVLHGASSRWSMVALGLFAAYALWTFVSLLWSPNRGDAWMGAGQTLLYLLMFWLAVGLVSLGASRRWALAASVIGPAFVAALTLPTLLSRADDFFENSRLVGTVGYYNGEAAFLLIPFWVSVYLAGSRGVNPFLRGLVLAGATLCVAVAVLAQSRGAMVAMVLSVPLFFLVSGQRVRGFFALAPLVLALYATFPGLNAVYQALLNEESATTALEQALPTVYLAAAGAGLYGLLWGLLDRRWELTSSVTRPLGAVALACGVAVVVLGLAAASEQAGDPVSWAGQRWEAFKNDDTTGQEQSRYLVASGSGRYSLWKVAWEDFASRPLLGIGTHNYEETYYQLRETALGFVRQPHILPLEVLSERGVVGGVLFFGFLAACLGAGLAARFGNLSSEGKGQVGAMVGAIAYWFFHSSAEWFWQLPAVTLPAMVYLAMLAAPWRQAEAAPIRWPMRAVGAGLAVLAVAAIAPLYATDRYMTQSYSSTDPKEARAVVERAKGLNPLSPEVPQREAELAMKSGDWDRAEGALRSAVRLNPDHYAQHALLAKFYELRGDLEAALSSYRKALALNPLSADLKERMSKLEERSSD